MFRIKGLELLFNLEKTNIKCKEDCVVVVLHSLLINEGLKCVGIGDEWPDSGSWAHSELLPKGWNNNQDVYSLRYSTDDNICRILLKIVKSDHLLLINAAKNTDDIVSVDIPPADFVSDDYSEYSNAYKDLKSLAEIFSKDIMVKLAGQSEKSKSSSEQKNTKEHQTQPSCHPSRIPPSYRPEPDLGSERGFRFQFPQVGGADLDPFGGGRGGMFMDPSGFGIPARPSLPDFGVGGPGGLPRGAVPPGARFDPFRPPIRPDRPGPNPDYYSPDSFDFI